MHVARYGGLFFCNPSTTAEEELAFCVVHIDMYRKSPEGLVCKYLQIRCTER